MEIKQQDDGQKGMFFVEEDQQVQAKMTYVWTGTDRIIIDHTEVGPALKGLGAGKQLVAAAVSFARSKGISIIPLCSFAKSVFEKVPEYRDVL